MFGKFFERKKILFFLAISFLILPIFTFADTFGQEQKFYVDKGYDAKSREEVVAVLQKVSNYAYFYLEKEWYQNLPDIQRAEVNNALYSLANEFDNNIYPKLTSFYGSVWTPGIDNDPKITILFHQLKEGAGGYFNSGDEYLKVQYSKSNQREMIYVNADTLFSKRLSAYVAHEFVHLITFYQKEKLRNVEEDVWLNELRAEYAPTYLGYNKNFTGSYLQQRVKDLILTPNDSLTEWHGERADYGIINLFAHYLAENYGENILSDSMQSSKTGIASLDEALEKNGFSKNLFQVFTDFVITLYLNDCSLSQFYCFKNPDLKTIKITPSLIIVPRGIDTQVSLNYFIKPWSGNWYQIYTKGNLTFYFDGKNNQTFQPLYIYCQKGSCKVEKVFLDNNAKGSFAIENLDQNNDTLVFVPILSTLIENVYPFSLTIKNTYEDQALIESLKAKVLELQMQIEEIRKQIAQLLRKKISCQSFDTTLSFGQRNEKVKCLQEFLKWQGKEIYPEGLVTGYYGILTKAAVKRFQEKYQAEILAPQGLKFGTGNVDKLTLEKINQILNYGL